MLPLPSPFRAGPFRAAPFRADVVTPVTLAALLALGAPTVGFAQSAPPQSDAAAQPDNAADVADDGQAQDDDAQAGDIVVTAASSRGAVISEVPADQVLDANAIASYGASSLAELVTSLSAQTRAGGGRGAGFPVILVEGRRISGFGEIRNLPTEAIERVEIFPESVALDYGYPADQRVMNILLKDGFVAFTGEAEAGIASDGGRWSHDESLGYLRLTGRGRLNITLSREQASPLTEAERHIIQPATSQPLTANGVITAPLGGEIDPALSAAAGRPIGSIALPVTGTSLADFANAAGNAILPLDRGRFRSLSGETGNWSLDGSFATPISQNIGLSVNLRYGETSSERLNGLPVTSVTVPVGNPASPFAGPVLLSRAFAGPLTSRNDASSLHGGFSSDGRLGRWRWTLTGNYDRGVSRTVTDRGPDYAALQAAINAGANPFIADPSAITTKLTPDMSRTVSNTGEVDAVLSGPLFTLPAGAVRATFQTGWKGIGFDSISERAGVVSVTDLSRTAYTASGNIDIPVTDRSADVLGFLGELSLNVRYALRDVSDFRTLTSWTAGFNWEPVDRLNLIATWTANEDAPSVSQLGGAVIVTPLQTIFDYSRNETVLANVISGGNAALLAERQRDFRAQASWRPIEDVNLNLSVTYARARSFDTTASFPELTPEIEAAFPGRVTRDIDGHIISVDQRPVNFAATFGRQIRYGINFAHQFGTPARGMFGGPGGGPRPGGGGGGPRPRGGPGGGGGGPAVMFGGRGGGRWDINVFHLIRLEDEILIRPGVPVLDLLGGSATGASGGSPRHEVELTGGWFLNGLGVRLFGTWKSGSHVDGGATGTRLDFSSTFVASARIFMNVGQQEEFVQRFPFMRNVRVRLAIDNILNDRQSVRDQNGQTPLRYQPAYLNPIGRTISFEIRKQF